MTKSPQRKKLGRRKYSRKQLMVAIAALAGIVVLVIAFIVGAQANSDSSSPTAAPTPTATASAGSEAQPASNFGRRIDGDPTAMGAIDAPVVLVEYADYRCPFCGVLSRDTMPAIISEYVDSGQLRIEWRDFPIFEEPSVQAAVAARAAGEQGLFWEYNEAVYASAPESGHLEINLEKILNYAREVGVPDMAKFESDLTNPNLLALVQADAVEAQRVGATSVPAILINSVPVVGAQPLQVYKDIIDEQLRLAGQ